MSKLCRFSFKIKMKHKHFIINKPNIMKKSKYQQYFHCFIACVLGHYTMDYLGKFLVEYSNYSIKRRI